MYCKKCGKQIAGDSNFCKYCGALLDEPEQAVKINVPDIVPKRKPEQIMKDETKHLIAHTVYVLCKILTREIRLALKPLGIGFIILVTCLAASSIIERGRDFNELFSMLGFIGFFIPLMVKYYKRIRTWVLKWK